MLTYLNLNHFDKCFQFCLNLNHFLCQLYLCLLVCIPVMVIRMPLFSLWNDIEIFYKEGTYTLQQQIRGRISSSIAVDNSSIPTSSGACQNQGVFPRVSIY